MKIPNKGVFFRVMGILLIILLALGVCFILFDFVWPAMFGKDTALDMANWFKTPIKDASLGSLFWLGFILVLIKKLLD